MKYQFVLNANYFVYRDPDAPAPPMDGSTGAANLPGLPARQQSSESSSSDSDYEFESD